MTKHELNQIYYLTKEVKIWEEELYKLKNQSYIKSPKLTGVPQSTCKSDKVSNTASKISDLEKLIEKKLQEIQEHKKQIMQYILSIEDSQTRMVFKMRCIDLYNWNKIAQKIGGNNTPDGVRKIYERYIRRHS